MIRVWLCFLMACCCTGCGKKIEKYGEAPSEMAAKTVISSILLSPQEYIDKEVVIEGVITSECPAGGWIVVKDDLGHKLYVDMHGTAFAPIPHRVGDRAIVKGLVFQSSGATKEIKILGKGVLIKK